MENVKSRRLRYVRRMKKEKTAVQNIHINTKNTDKYMMNLQQWIKNVKKL